MFNRVRPCDNIDKKIKDMLTYAISKVCDNTRKNMKITCFLNYFMSSSWKIVSYKLHNQHLTMNF